MCTWYFVGKYEMGELNETTCRLPKTEVEDIVSNAMKSDIVCIIVISFLFANKLSVA